jgi:FAD/FMN-containing dehydrogenase
VHTDTAVPVSAVPAFVARVEASVGRRWPNARTVIIGHMGDGNIHVSLHAPEGWTAGQPAWSAAAHEVEPLVNEIAVALGGSFSAEHGIGVSKRHAMLAHKSPVAVDVMRRIKAALDPDGRMNPGKVLP